MQARGLEMMRKLALIVSFCLGTAASPVFALGLGEIELQSALNEPLRAEIPLFAVRPGQRDLITARVADTEAFIRAGIERSSILSDIRFAVAPGATPDQAVLQLRTLTPVREPFLTVLIEVTSPEGRLIREYTALVDPPGTARAPSSRARPADSGALTTRPYTPTGEAPARAGDAGAHEYGPVRADETLWSIAYAQRPSDSITMDQMMLAIYEANPDAFDGSVNRIRAGSMLRIPSAESIRAIDPDQARREVGQQRRRTSAPAREEVVETPPAVAPPPAEAEPAPPPKPKGELRLSTPEGAAPTPATPSGDTLPAAPPPPVVEEAPAVPPPTTTEGPPPAAVEAPAPVPARSTTPIEIRDNSAKALELLAVHAREHSAQQAAGDQVAAETAQPAPAPLPAPEAPATAPSAPPPTPAEPAPPAESAPAAPPAPADSPFADQPTEAQPSSPAVPAPPSAAQAPAAESPPPATPPPPVPEPVVADTDGVLGALNPLMLGLAAAAALLIGLGAVKLRQRRRRPVTLAPIVLSEVEPGANTFGQTLETPAPRPAAPIADTLQATVPPAARTIETTMQSTMPPERTTQQFMAVSTPQPSQAPAPPPAGATPPGGVDPYADALSEVDIHIAYGLYDEAARLLQEPLAKSPERKDLHLKLLEVYFSANLPNEFEAQAKTMRSIVGNDADPDWQKACIMGQQLCPASPLFAAGSAAAGAAIGATADMDFSSMLGSAQAPAPAAPAASTPSLDFGGLDLGLDKAATVKPPPKPAAAAPAPPAPAAAEANTLDFNLEDFKLDVPASVSSPPPVAAAPAPDDAGLDIDLSDFDVGTPAAPAAAAPSAAPAGGEIDMDDLLAADAVEGAGEQADTRLDLARAYMDMGEPAMAQSLLQEVIAQGNPGQKQEAQELLNRLSAG